MGPCAPVAPMPVAPTGPVGPSIPVAPIGPIDPIDERVFLLVAYIPGSICASNTKKSLLNAGTLTGRSLILILSAI